MPCQDFLAQLREVHPRLSERGVEVLAVGGSTQYQAEMMQPEFPFPLLVDPDQQLRAAVGFGNLKPWQYLKWSGAKRYIGPYRRGARQGRVTRDTKRTPGVVILDQELDLVWAHEGSGLGDYPMRDDVLRALDDVQRR